MLRLSHLLAVALLLSVSAARVSAQAVQPGSSRVAVPLGSEVRVLPVLSTHWAAGTLMRADSDSVMVYRRGQGLLAVPTWQVTRFQRAAGRDHAGGAVRGLLIGLAACIPLVASAGDGGGDGAGGALVALGGIVVLPSLGFVAGAIVGMRRWRDVPVPGARPPADSAAPAAVP
jgi:hypothetical protein